MTSRAQHFRTAETMLDRAEHGLAITLRRIGTADLTEAEQLTIEVAVAHATFIAAQVHATLATVEAILLDEDDRTARTVDLSAPVR